MLAGFDEKMPAASSSLAAGAKAPALRPRGHLRLAHALLTGRSDVLGATALEDLLRLAALVRALGMDREEDVAALHTRLVLLRLELGNAEADQRASDSDGTAKRDMSRRVMILTSCAFIESEPSSTTALRISLAPI